MIVVACVDDKNGMMFNHRRQSRDSAVCMDILSECGGKDLYMSVYSGKLFEGMEEEAKNKVKIKVTDDFLNQAGKEDVCFLEDTDITGYEDQVWEVILYRWNRRYPANQHFTLDLSDETWELTRMEEFEGSSHERITKEVYRKVR